MKWLKRIVIVVILLAVVGILAIWLGGNYAARKGVEVAGTHALGVDTKLDSVSIGWLSSSVAIRGLTIGNPEGYKTDRLMALGHSKVACQISSLTSDEVAVKEILVDAPELTVELKPGIPPKSNLGDLLAKLQSDKAAPEKKEEEASQKKFKVDLIRVTKTKVRFHMIGGKTADLVLPDIEMKDVKNADGTPLLMADIFRQVLASMATSVAKSGKGVLPDDMLKNFGDSTAVAQEILGKGLEAIRKGVGKDIGKGIGGALEGLLGKDKKDK